MCLLNYLIGMAKLAIWKQERIKAASSDGRDPRTRHRRPVLQNDRER